MPASLIKQDLNTDRQFCLQSEVSMHYQSYPSLAREVTLTGGPMFLSRLDIIPTVQIFSRQTPGRSDIEG